MDTVTFVTWIVTGLVAGWLAGIVLKGEGYGLRADLLLGVAGSIAFGGAALAMGGGPGTGRVLTAVIAFVGAASLMLTQRTMLPNLASSRPRLRVAPKSR
jgi:uncharacterized membrane protein YeaQ/YmgE (transglycosylase-associated protein family)